MMSAGGITKDAKQADDAIQEMIEKVREEIESKVGEKFEQFVALQYRTQLVNGVNYFVKVKVRDNQSVHVRVHKTFSGDLTLASVQPNKALEEELVYFERD